DASKVSPPARNYWWVAAYGGDTSNAAATSPCDAEPVVVGPAAPRIATTKLPDSGVVGATFKDRASLAGLFGAHAGGSVSWKLFPNKACEGDPVASDGPVSVSGDGDYETPAGAAPSAAGTYYWVASYGGDANNEGVSSGCADRSEERRVGEAWSARWQPDGSEEVGATFKDTGSGAALVGVHGGGAVSGGLLGK